MSNLDSIKRIPEMDRIKNLSKTAYISRTDLLKFSYFGQQWFLLYDSV